MLLLNERNSPEWEVFVDGKKERLLRCNFIMRGVQVPAGEHQVEFAFHPDHRALHLTFAGLGVGAVAGLILLLRRKPAAPAIP